MRSVLIEMHCFPCVAYFHCMLHSEAFILEAKENYNKRSYRNKFDLLSDKGPQSFSIPLQKGKHEQQPISETQISYDENWPSQLERTLKTYYGSSPFFDHYMPGLAEIIHSGERSLWNFNFSILSHLMNVLSLQVSLACTTDFEKHPEDTMDLRSVITPRCEVEHKTYPQVFEDKIGFVSNMSILDLLFALGPESKNFLLTSSMSCQL